ncbi:MAG: hypothetical protein RLZZ299_3083 [Pseudomonadota bacterium]
MPVGPAYLSAPAQPARAPPSYLAATALVLAAALGITAPAAVDAATAHRAQGSTDAQARLSALHAELAGLGAAYPPADPVTWSGALRRIVSDRALREPTGPAWAHAAAVQLRAAALQLVGLSAARDPIARDPARITRMRHAIDAAHPARLRPPEVPTHAP